MRAGAIRQRSPGRSQWAGLAGLVGGRLVLLAGETEERGRYGGARVLGRAQHDRRAGRCDGREGLDLVVEQLTERVGVADADFEEEAVVADDAMDLEHFRDAGEHLGGLPGAGALGRPAEHEGEESLA